MRAVLVGPEAVLPNHSVPVAELTYVLCVLTVRAVLVGPEAVLPKDSVPAAELTAVIVLSVRAVLVGPEAVLPDHPVPAAWEPRVSPPHRVLHLQAGM